MHQPSLIKSHKLLFFVLLAIGGGTIFKAMYLREVFYYPWNEFFGLTNTQSGMLMSWLGFVGIISGAISGIIVDKFKNPKSILAFAYIAMSILAVWQSFKPSYGPMFFIVGCMSFVGNGLFLVSMTKIARLIAADNEQGRYFGFLESGRGVAGTILTIIAVSIVSYSQSESLSIGFILRFDAAVYFILGIISYKMFPSGVGVLENAEPKKISDLMEMLKSIKLWLAAIAITATIFIYQSAQYLVPYLTDAYGMSAETSAIVGMIRAYCLAFVVSPFAGYFADKVGSTIKVMLYLFIAGAIICISFIFVPQKVVFLFLVITLVLCIGGITFGLRGIMYAQVNEIKIPKQYTGTAMGILICIGFSPEAYVHIIFGKLLDLYKQDSYPIMFSIMSIVLIIGAISSYILYKMTYYKNNKQ